MNNNNKHRMIDAYHSGNAICFGAIFKSWFGGISVNL